MFDFNPLPGAIRPWLSAGKLIGYVVAFKKRRRRKGKSKSNTVVRLMTPEEYAKLTKDPEKQ